MRLNTIATIELSSVCNLSCKYCVNRLMVQHGRTPGIMTDEVFDKSIDLLKCLTRRGTQKEINLNGNGESCLDPQLFERIACIREILGPDKLLQFCTNGVNLTPDMIRGIADAGVNKLHLSPHDSYHIRRVVPLIIDAGVELLINPGSLISSHNWAGQLEPENSIDVRLKIVCHPLREGRGYIQDHGGISPCCYDYRGLGQFGTVFDEDILDKPVARYSLCDTCHQKIEGD